MPHYISPEGYEDEETQRIWDEVFARYDGTGIIRDSGPAGNWLTRILYEGEEAR